MIREEVYDKLKSAKLPEESFSDCIERLLGSKGDIDEFFGMWSDLPAAFFDDLEKDIERRRRLAGKSRPKGVAL
jgi:predicted CopG family antitoxin